MNATASTHAAPLDLWRIASGFLNTLYNLFGAPEDIAHGYALTREAHKLLSAWLRAGEALLRRLLLIEAGARVEAIGAPRAKAARTPQANQQKPQRLFKPQAPEQWRVSFKCFAPRRVKTVQQRKRSRRFAPRPMLSAWPLAERYEAMLRVVNNPAPHAIRLARRLAAAPGRIAALLAPPRPRKLISGEPPDAADMVGRQAFAQVEHAARAASRRFPDSS